LVNNAGANDGVALASGNPERFQERTHLINAFWSVCSSSQ
jgi:hypothetical protein